MQYELPRPLEEGVGEGVEPREQFRFDPVKSGHGRETRRRETHRRRFIQGGSDFAAHSNVSPARAFAGAGSSSADAETTGQGSFFMRAWYLVQRFHEIAPMVEVPP